VSEFQTREQFYAAIKRAQSGDTKSLAEVRSFADNPRRREQAIRASSGSGVPQPRPRSASSTFPRAGSRLTVTALKVKAHDARRRAF